MSVCCLVDCLHMHGYDEEEEVVLVDIPDLGVTKTDDPYMFSVSY